MQKIDVENALRNKYARFSESIKAKNQINKVRNETIKSHVQDMRPIYQAISEVQVEQFTIAIDKECLSLKAQYLKILADRQAKTQEMRLVI